MSGIRGERDLCQKKMKLINQGIKQKQRQKQLWKWNLKGLRYEDFGIGGIRFIQWATQTSLANRLNLQYIECYHNSKYEPNKQPQNVDLKQLALLKK